MYTLQHRKIFRAQSSFYSLHNVDLLHQRVTHVSAVQRVICSVEAAPERVSQPIRADLGQGCVVATGF